MGFQLLVAQKEDNMNTFDLTPFYRHSIGFDHLENIFDSMIKMNDVTDNYPPYNIHSNGKDNYTIELAVAGFDEKNLSINLEDGLLTISGNKDNENSQYMHRGIANRSFRRTFRLAEYVEVIGAGIKNGILQIHLERKLPEELKPKNIEIKTGSAFKKFLDNTSKKILKDFLNEYEKISKINKVSLEKIINTLIDKHKTNFKNVGQPLRIALTGSRFGPGIYDIILSLDKNETIKRLKLVE